MIEQMNSQLDVVNINLIQNKRIVVFDVCGTLYASNTTIEFVIFHLIKNGKYLKAIFFRILYYKILSFIAYRLFKYNLRFNCIAALSSFTKSNIDVSAVAFFDEVLENKKNSKLLCLLKKYRDSDSYSIFLASASIDPIVSEIAKRFGVGWVSSQLNYDYQNICVGSLLSDVTGDKSHVLNLKYGLSVIDGFYSDNIEDLLNSKNVKKFYLVKNGFVQLVKALKLRRTHKFTFIDAR